MSQALIQLGPKKKAASPSGSGKKTTVGFVNLGCTKNQVDSEIMLGTLAADGFGLTGNPKKAEVVIINTCGFIEEAKQESINTILEHAKLKQSGACRVLIAAGCLAQRYQGDLLKELPEVICAKSCPSCTVSPLQASRGRLPSSAATSSRQSPDANGYGSVSLPTC